VRVLATIRETNSAARWPLEIAARESARSVASKSFTSLSPVRRKANIVLIENSSDSCNTISARQRSSGNAEVEGATPGTRPALRWPGAGKARWLLVKIPEKHRQCGALGLLGLVARNLHWTVRRFFDARFDQRFGIATVGETNLDDLAIDSPNKHFGLPYVATPVATFRHMMSYLPRHLDRFTFIDLGCGKGRMLAAATEYGFRRIIGIDFSAELCAIAEQNMAAVRDRTEADIEIVNADAADFQIPNEDCVIYLYSPFGPPVLERVADNIRACQRRSPRRIYLIYYNAVHAGLLAGRLDFMHVVRSGRWRFDPAARRARPFTILAAEPHK
jgi:SAM-dependent methyltransferase